MPVARPEPADTRIIAHVDLDCFYVQVEQRRHPELKGKPTAVVMYNPWKGGGIIAVGYEARGAGVTRSMRGDDAKKICPQINLIQVPTHFGKADLSVYRDAGSEVVAVFSRGGVCERASIDEVYLDVTEAALARLQTCPPDAGQSLSKEVLDTLIVGLGKDQGKQMEGKDWLCRSNAHASRSDQLLACGAIIIAELRMAVRTETGFTTSAGIAHNKMLAKLASGMHKPAQQTLIPSSGAPDLLASLPIKKIKGLGGKLGVTVQHKLGIKTIGDLLPYSESKLQDLYGTNTGTWLWRVARGMSGDEVEGRTLPKSHGCGKTFPGPKSLKSLESVAHWLSELSGELQERLDLDLHQNNRTARLLVCHSACHLIGKGDSPLRPFPSKSCAIRYGKEKIASDAVILFKRALNEFCPSAYSLSPIKGERAVTDCKWGVTGLSITATNIIDASGTASITQFFAAQGAATHTATVCEPTSVIMPPSSSSASSLSVEEPAVQDGLGMKFLGRDEMGSNGQELGDPMTTETGTSYRIPTELLDEVATHPLDFLDCGVFQAGQPSPHPHHGAVMSDSNMDVFPKTEVYEQADKYTRDRSLLDFGDCSRPMQTSSITREALSRPGGLQGQAGPSLQKLDFGSTETLCEVENTHFPSLLHVVLEGRAADSGSGREVNLQENLIIHGICGSPSRPSAISLGPDSGSEDNPVTGREFPEALASYSKIATQDSQPRSERQNAIEPIISGPSASQQIVPTSSSKRLIFQRVDDLWEKSKPATQLSPTAKQVGSRANTWNYKRGEIDESVLLELPEEMQLELRNQFGLKRPKTGKRGTVSDFFKTNSSAPN